MAAVATTRIRWDDAAIERLRDTPGAVATVREAAQEMAAEMAAGAPRRTGAGAAAIRARATTAPEEFTAGWDREHDYLWFQEFGTRYVDPVRFARDVLDSYKYD